MTVGKTYKFDAAHFLPDHPKCGQLHGHTYTVTVEVVGKVNPETGMVIDLHVLDSFVEPIIKKLDHHFINDSIPIPTCENIAKWFLLQLSPLIPLPINIKVQEGAGGYART